MKGMDAKEIGQLSARILDRVGTVVVGNRYALELVLAGVLAGGHVLLEDLPGLGKTLTARSFAQALGLDFRRLQFTPDLLPADVTGSFLYDQRTHDFTFRAGPVFTNLLLADEINRTPPKTQAALLEAMQEKQVSVEGVTYRLDPPFHVLATANPIEYEGTYPLPEAQLDRFLLRVSFGYPAADEELIVLRRRMERKREEAVLEPVVDPRDAGADAGGAGGHRGRGLHRALPRRADRGHARAPRRTRGRFPARHAGAAAPVAGARGDGRARLRDPRGRQAGRPARAGAPDDFAARDVAQAGRPRRRRARGARGDPVAGQRVGFPSPPTKHGFRVWNTMRNRNGYRPEPWAGRCSSRASCCLARSCSVAPISSCWPHRSR
jgi:hypothetical protein